MKAFGWQRQYFLATAVIAGLGLADALLLGLAGGHVFRQAFSLLEMLWVPVSLLFVAANVTRRDAWAVPLLFLAYQVAVWFYGRWLLLTTGKLVIPAGLVVLAVLVYGGLLVLSWRAARPSG